DTWGHSVQCPVAELAARGVTLPPRAPNVKLAVVVFPQDREGRLLVTQRAAHMRTFPRCWVFPGGGVDEGEALAVAASRELVEETGLSVTPSSLQPLCLWESVFPTSVEGCIEAGQVKGHSVTVFLEALLDPATAGNVVLQSSECERCAWVSLQWLMDLHSPSAFEVADGHGTELPLLNGWQVVRTEEESEATAAALKECKIEATQLSGIYPNAVGEGIGQGHLFALSVLWSKRLESSNL
ncbi:nudt17, partial [Symbiodinium pilosum]